MTDAGKTMVLPKGEYSATVQYEKYDCVLFSGALYIALKNNLGITPTNDKVNWMLYLSASTVNVDDMAPTFEEATVRNNIFSGEKLSVIFGKIKKWFTDLKTVAFTGSYNDLEDTPPIGNGTITIKQNNTVKGTFTTNQTGNAEINLTDTDTKVTVDASMSSTSTNPVQNKVIYNKFKEKLEDLSTKAITIPDNGGNMKVLLMYDITSWVTASANIGLTGFEGLIFTVRAGGYNSPQTIKLSIASAWGGKDVTAPDNQTLTLRTESGMFLPCVVLHESKYYLALRVRGSGRTAWMFGYFRGTWIGTWVNCTDTSGTLPSGYSYYIKSYELQPYSREATTTQSGLMTKEMVTKLNGIAEGANKYTLPKATASALGGVIISTSSSVTDSAGRALAASEKNASIDGTLANQIAALNNDLGGITILPSRGWGKTKTLTFESESGGIAIIFTPYEILSVFTAASQIFVRYLAGISEENEITYDIKDKTITLTATANRLWNVFLLKK